MTSESILSVSLALLDLLVSHHYTSRVRDSESSGWNFLMNVRSTLCGESFSEFIYIQCCVALQLTKFPILPLKLFSCSNCASFRSKSMAGPPSTPTALLLIDNQKGFNHPTHWGTSRSNPNYERNTKALLSAFRAIQEDGRGPAPLIIHIFHNSLNPNSPLHSEAGDGIDFLPFAQPKKDEYVISKHVNSSFIGTNLEKLLRSKGIRRLVICGLTIDHCVSTTTRMAANLGVTDYPDEEGGELSKGRVILVHDATATFNRGPWDAETMHNVSVESLRDEFAEMMTTEEVLDMLRSE